MKRNSRIHKAARVLLYGSYLIIAVLVLLEILLRIYNPFHLRIKGDRVILPVNQRLITKNSLNPRLDSIIVNTRNAIGLRGPELPDASAKKLKILTVGGSTTECYFLNDDSTWPSRLSGDLGNDFHDVWLNNAGLSGHSSFGHIILVEDHLLNLKPDIIIFLTGINDIENDGPSFHDKLNTRGSFPDLAHYLYNSSEVVNLVVNIMRGFRAQRLINTTDKFKPPVAKYYYPHGDQLRKRVTAQQKYLGGYRARLQKLTDLCRSHSVLPVFMTQPLLYGPGIDSVTNVNLAAIDLDNGTNGELFWQLLGMYNDVVKEVAAKNVVPCIDLASMMPKNSWYYYDGAHFTNEGATLVAKIVAHQLSPVIAKKFPQFKR